MPQCLHMKRTAHSEELEETHRTWIWTSDQQKQIGPIPTRHLIFTEGKRTGTAHKPRNVHRFSRSSNVFWNICKPCKLFPAWKPVKDSGLDILISYNHNFSTCFHNTGIEWMTQAARDRKQLFITLVHCNWRFPLSPPFTHISSALSLFQTNTPSHTCVKYNDAGNI